MCSGRMKRLESRMRRKGISGRVGIRSRGVKTRRLYGLYECGVLVVRQRRRTLRRGRL